MLGALRAALLAENKDEAALEQIKNDLAEDKTLLNIVDQQYSRLEAMYYPKSTRKTDGDKENRKWLIFNEVFCWLLNGWLTALPESANFASKIANRICYVRTIVSAEGQTKLCVRAGCKAICDIYHVRMKHIRYSNGNNGVSQVVITVRSEEPGLFVVENDGTETDSIIGRNLDGYMSGSIFPPEEAVEAILDFEDMANEAKTVEVFLDAVREATQLWLSETIEKYKNKKGYADLNCEAFYACCRAYSQKDSGEAVKANDYQGVNKLLSFMNGRSNKPAHKRLISAIRLKSADYFRQVGCQNTEVYFRSIEKWEKLKERLETLNDWEVLSVRIEGGEPMKDGKTGYEFKEVRVMLTEGQTLYSQTPLSTPGAAAGGYVTAAVPVGSGISVCCQSGQQAEAD